LQVFLYIFFIKLVRLYNNQIFREMENLKLKFKLNGLEFEIEGGEKTVKEEFENFKTFITGELISKLTTQQIHAESPSVPSLSNIDVTSSTFPKENFEETDFPVLKEVVQRDLPQTEKNWTLIYAFYISNFGNGHFTLKDIINSYKDTGRYTINRSKKFSQNLNLLLNEQLIKVLNDEQYIIKESGIEHAKSILTGTLQIKERKSAKINKVKTSDNGKTKKTSKAKSISQEKFDIHKDNENTSLEDFLNSINHNGITANIILCIGYYITKIKGIQNFSEGNIEYAYRTLNIKGRPIHLRQTIINAKNNKDFFDSSDDSRWIITRTGEIFVEEKLQIE
jgi:hypothetical protein